MEGYRRRFAHTQLGENQPEQGEEVVAHEDPVKVMVPLGAGAVAALRTLLQRVDRVEQLLRLNAEALTRGEVPAGVVAERLLATADFIQAEEPATTLRALVTEYDLLM